MNVLPRTRRRGMLGILAWAACLGGVASVFSDRLVACLLPLWRQEITLLYEHWRVDRLWIDHEGADQVIRASFGLRGCLSIGGRMMCDIAEPLGNASTLLGNATVPGVLLLAITLGWPTTSWREVGMRGLLALGGLLLLCVTDVPLTLAAAFWDLWQEDVLRIRAYSPLQTWAAFLQAGGRDALALVLAVAAVALGAVLGTGTRRAR